MFFSLHIFTIKIEKMYTGHMLKTHKQFNWT